MPPSWAQGKRPGGAPNASDAKRSRAPRDDDDDDMDDIDDMIEQEEDLANDEPGGPAPPEEEEAIKMLGSKDMAQFERQWRRPPLPPLDSSMDAIVFQQFEADYVTASVPADFARGSSEPKAAVVRLFGVTRAGNSVAVHVHGFRPYFYVRAPPSFAQGDVEPFKRALAGRLRAQANQKDGPSEYVLSCSLVMRQSIMHYNFDQQTAFVRIVVALPSMVSTARRILEQARRQRPACALAHRPAIPLPAPRPLLHTSHAAPQPDDRSRAA